MKTNPTKKILLCGGSAGNHVLASILGGRHDYDVRLVTSRPERWSHRIECIEKCVFSDTIPLILPSWYRQYQGTLSAIYDWSQIRQAAEDVDLILLSCPVYAHRSILEKLLPALDPNRNHRIGTLYAQGGFDWIVRDILQKQGIDASHLVVFGLKRFPFLCKVKDYGSTVTLHGRFPQIVVAIRSPVQNGHEKVTSLLHDIFKKPIQQLPSFLPCTFALSNQILHPGICLGLFAGYVDNETSYRRHMKFYGDCNALASCIMHGITEEIRDLAAAVQEAVGIPILEYLGADPLHRVYWRWLEHPLQKKLQKYRLYQKLRDEITALTFRHHMRLRDVPAPMQPDNRGGYIPDFSSRFWQDDLPHGLCVLLSMAEILGKPMPFTYDVVRTHQAWMKKAYIAPNASERPRLDGPDAGETNAPQSYGIHDLEGLREFVRWPV